MSDDDKTYYVVRRNGVRFERGEIVQADNADLALELSIYKPVLGESYTMTALALGHEVTREVKLA